MGPTNVNHCIEPSGNGFKITLPNGQVIKSDNKQALSDLLVTSERQRKREERFCRAWNSAVELAGQRYFHAKSATANVSGQVNRLQLNLKQIDWAIGRVNKSEGAFLAALYVFEDPIKGQEFLARTGCSNIRALAEMLSPAHSHVIAQLFVACRDG